jgi:hypothetical protein
MYNLNARESLVGIFFRLPLAVERGEGGCLNWTFDYLPATHDARVVMVVYGAVG